MKTKPQAEAQRREGAKVGAKGVRMIQIGAMCPPLSKQLAGLVSAKDGVVLDMHNDAITRCNLFGFMSDSNCVGARNRLLSLCKKAVADHTSAHRSVSSVPSVVPSSGA